MNDLNKNDRKEVTSMVVAKVSDSIGISKDSTIPISISYEYLTKLAKKEDIYKAYIEKMGNMNDGLFNVSTLIFKHNFRHILGFHHSLNLFVFF